MKKNFSVNIGGRIFNIDEDAYERLNLYLNNLRNFFANEEGREEIISDIESRIAELLEARKTSESGIITLEHIIEVISSMGEPDQLSGEDKSTTHNQEFAKPSGKLFRDSHHHLLGGVASGIAAYFGINTVLMRLIFVALTFFYGIGAFIYVILWIILPAARTTSERLEMQRRMINIDTLRDEITSTGAGLKNTGNTVLNSTGKLLRFITEILTHIFRLVLKVIRIAGGAALLLLAPALLIGLSTAFLIHEPFHTGYYHLDNTNFMSFVDWALPGPSTQWLAYISAMLILVGLTGLLIYLGLRLMFKWPPFRWTIFGLFGLLLIAGLISGGGTVYQYSRSVSAKASKTELKMMALKSPSLHLIFTGDNPDYFWKPINGQDISKTIQDVLGEVSISVRPASGDSLTFALLREASSYSEDRASEYLDKLSYSYQYQDTLLMLDPYFRFPKSEGLHNQHVELILGIPLNKSIRIDEDMAWKINFRDFVDERGQSGEYIMTAAGLKFKEVPPAISDTTEKKN